MPRISEELVLGSVTYKAARPQDGDSPASFREAGTQALSAKRTVNIGTGITSTGGRNFYRSKVSFVIPRSDVDNKPLTSDRIDITARLDSVNTEAEIIALQAQLVALVTSTEFRLAMQGEPQF